MVGFRPVDMPMPVISVPQPREVLNSRYWEVAGLGCLVRIESISWLWPDQ